MLESAATYSLLFVSLFFEVFLLVSFLERRMSLKTPQASVGIGVLPSVCIVVPCFNEEKSIAGTLASLLALEYPAGKLEVLVVDDGSTDNTFAVAKKFESDTRVKVFHKENGGKHTAMNYALERTQAELIGCLDADSVVEKGALLKVAAIFGDTRIAAVTPGIHVREPKTLLQHIQKVEYRLSVFNRFALAAIGSVFITPGPFSIFRASVVRELGGWREGHSTEDMEMALRIQVAGHLIANAPEAIVHTSTPSTLKGLFRQRVRWTYGWLRNASDYRSLIGNRSYGNLGIIILPSALISIAAGMYFFTRVLWSIISGAMHEIIRVQTVGVSGVPSFNAFYLPTSMLWFLVWASVGLILTLICLGSFIGTGKRLPPASTPLFLFLYSFLTPLWLFVAVYRAAFKMGVRWR